MANIKQQKKRIQTDAKKRLANRMFKSKIKTAINKAEKAIEQKDKNANSLVVYAQKLLDKTVNKKIKKLNLVSRKKSRLQKQLNTQLSLSKN